MNRSFLYSKSIFNSRRLLHAGNLNGPAIKFVPVCYSERPYFWTQRGVRERWYRWTLTVKKIMGFFLWSMITNCYQTISFVENSTNLYPWIPPGTFVDNLC